MTLYGFSIKRNDVKNPTQQDYIPILKILTNKGTISDFVYETDSKGKLHIHGILEVIKTPYFKSLIPKGYGTKFEEIYDLAGWQRYIHLDIANIHESMQLADSVFCRYNYIFDKPYQN